MSSIASNDSDLQGENLLQDSAYNDEQVAEARMGLENLAITPVRAPRDEGGMRVKVFEKACVSNRLVIALDYGTTFTGFAFAYVDSMEVDLESIEVVQDWTAKMSNQQKVRSLISYTTPLNGEAQWGADISKNAITMVNTKLELDLQDSLFDELDLTLNVLRGTGNLEFERLRKAGPDPDYTCKSPTEIVTDYLSKIYECVRNKVDLDALVQTKTAVDIVVTVPVNWSYEANDSTFKAIRGAGFNKTNFPMLRDTILVPEPEAASYFTVRDLQAGGTEFLRVNDCFVLCDAGGGTVDVVSFQVKRTEPYFELEKATKPKSGRFGSAFIDTAFKTWLRSVITVEEYVRLDPANGRQRLSAHTVESGPMRTLIKDFEAKKKAFADATQDIKLNLPAPLDHLNIKDRVNDGELIIRGSEMKKLVDTCVSEVIELIKDQIGKIGVDKNRRTKNVFLVGGFGESLYLQKELRRSLKIRNMELRRPDHDKSWTAVVQGAVIYGIEKSRHKDTRFMAAMTKSYAILIDGQFKWLIRRGDLVLSNEKRRVNSEWFKIQQRDMVNYQLPVYVYLDVDGNDDVPELEQTGMSEVERVGVIKCDFSKYLDVNLRHSHMHGRPIAAERRGSRIGPLRCQFDFSQTSLEAGVFLEKARVGRCEISIEVDYPPRDETKFV